jgi:hypothetical protein
MTADEAAEITAGQSAVKPQAVDALHAAWTSAVKAAAATGAVQMYERDVSLPRMPLGEARAAVLDRLRADGFAVDVLASGEALVSWPARPASPPVVAVADQQRVTEESVH